MRSLRRLVALALFAALPLATQPARASELDASGHLQSVAPGAILIGFKR